VKRSIQFFFLVPLRSDPLPPSRSIFTIRSEPDVHICSTCLPQASIDEQCEEHRNMKWDPAAHCFANNSKIARLGA
jgi:hypothetical protein